MKKTMRFLSMAALALVGAVMTGCSSDEDFADFQQPEKKGKVVTLTTTVSLDGGAATRALDDSGQKTFAVGDEMAVFYVDYDELLIKKAVSHALTASDISNEGKSANFTFDLDNPDDEADTEMFYVYPASMAASSFVKDSYWDDGNKELVDYSGLAAQDGTLESLGSTLDLATFETDDWTQKNPANLKNQLSVLAMTLKDGDGTNEITSSITDMTLSDGTNNYAVTRSAAAGPIYVAIRPTSSATIAVTATDGTTDYEKELTGKTYAKSNWYNVTWQMAPSLLSLTVTDPNNVVGGPKIIYYADGETWRQAIENHPTQNAGWGIDSWNEVIYTYNGDPWTVLVGDFYGAYDNNKIDANESYFFWN